MKRPEQELQIAICSHLASRSVPGVFWFHVPNAGKRSFFVGKKLRDAGLVAGVPDLLILMGGGLYALELKSPSGRLTPSQRLVMERMRNCGAQVAVAKSVDEALVTLEVWGILRREVGIVASKSVEASHDAAGDHESVV